MEAAPKHLIIVDGAIMQPIPEHPKKDYIFCLSTAFGDAYLFQVRHFYLDFIIICLFRKYRNSQEHIFNLRMYTEKISP